MITLTTVGYGDLVPSHWFDRLWLMWYMPFGTAALASTLDAFQKISVRSSIQDSNFKLFIDSLLAKHARGKVHRPSPGSAYAVLQLVARVATVTSALC